jgi:hypothetical protein
MLLGGRDQCRGGVVKPKLNATVVLFLVAVLSLSLSICAQAQSSTSQQRLQQYVADLQRNPNDTALREKIIKLALEMKPAPAIPEEARRHYVMAKTLFDGAKKPEDFGDSIAEFKSALLAAPWWPEANRDLGLALEAAQPFDEAITYVKLYMATNPGEERTRAAQDEIYKIGAKKQLAAKAAEESSPQAVAARQQDEYEAWHMKVNGRRYVNRSSGRDWTAHKTLDILGNRVVRESKCDSGCSDVEGSHEETILEGRRFRFGTDGKWSCYVNGHSQTKVFEGEFSSDGESATLENCQGGTDLYRWSR